MASSKSSNPKHKQLYTNQNLIFQGNQTFKVGLFSEKYTVWKSSIMSHLKWHFPLIFVLSKLTYLAKLFDCKLKVFKNSPKLTFCSTKLSLPNETFSVIFKQRAKSECNGIKVTIVHATNQMSSEFSLMLHCDHFWFQRRKTSIFCNKIHQNVLKIFFCSQWFEALNGPSRR